MRVVPSASGAPRAIYIYLDKYLLYIFIYISLLYLLIFIIYIHYSLVIYSYIIIFVFKTD